MKFGNIIIILFLLFIFYLGYKFVSVSSKVEDKKVSKTIKKMCFSGYQNCMPNKDCGILNPSTITKCDMSEDGQKICKSCMCEPNSNLTGCMGCQESDPNSTDESKVYILDDITDPNSCIDPLFWDTKDNKCKLSKGFYCLPTKMVDIKCNKYTGRKVLKKGDDGYYQWSCLCKDDTKFSGDSCTDINICSMLGSSSNPSNIRRGFRGIVRKGTTNDFWQGDTSDWDPLLEGECLCNLQGEVADNDRLVCATNMCTPGEPLPGDKTNKNCKCPSGYVNCQNLTIVDDVDSQGKKFSGFIDTGLCRMPSCVPDPCSGPDNDTDVGVYNETLNTCVCKPPYTLVNDPYSVLGVSCKHLCKDNGPCYSRGTCQISSENAVAKFSFNCFSTTDDGICTPDSKNLYSYTITYQDKSKNKHYLTYDKKSHNLYFEPVGKNDKDKTSFFNFEIKEDDQENISPKSTSIGVGVNQDLHSKFYYYMKIGDKYVNLSDSLNPTKTANSSDNDGLVENKELSLFRLIGDPKNPINNYGAIFIVNDKLYISADSENNIVQVPVSKSNGEICISCNLDKGWKQDDNQLCGKACIQAGQWSNWIAGSLDPQPNEEENCCYGNIINRDSQDTSDPTGWLKYTGVGTAYWGVMKLIYGDNTKLHAFQCGGPNDK